MHFEQNIKFTRGHIQKYAFNISENVNAPHNLESNNDVVDISLKKKKSKCVYFDFMKNEKQNFVLLYLFLFYIVLVLLCILVCEWTNDV